MNRLIESIEVAGELLHDIDSTGATNNGAVIGAGALHIATSEEEGAQVEDTEDMLSDQEMACILQEARSCLPASRRAQSLNDETKPQNTDESAVDVGEVDEIDEEMMYLGIAISSPDTAAIMRVVLENFKKSEGFKVAEIRQLVGDEMTRAVRTVVQKLHKKGLIERVEDESSKGKAITYAFVSDYDDILGKAKVLHDREQTRKRNLRKIELRPSAYDMRPHKETPSEFICNYISEFTGVSFQVDDLINAGFTDVVLSRRRDGQIAAAREVLRKLVDEGMLIPVTRHEYAPASVDRDTLQARQEEVKEFVQQSMDDVEYDFGLLEEVQQRIMTSRKHSKNRIFRHLDRVFYSIDALHQGSGAPKPIQRSSIDSQELYFSDMHQYPLLTDVGEKYLFELYERVEDYYVSEWIRQRLFVSNRRWVVKVAKSFATEQKHHTLLDLVSDGNMGLLHAIDLFDRRKGFKLVTYAEDWIKQAIGRAINRKSQVIRIPDNVHTELSTYSRVLREHNMSWSESTTQDIAELLGVDMEVVIKFGKLHRLTQVDSLNRVLRDDSDSELGDVCAAVEDDNFDESLPQELYNRFKHYIDPLEKQVLELRFCVDDPVRDSTRSHKEISDVLGIDTLKVQKLLRSAIDNLRQVLQTHNIAPEDYLVF